MKCKIIYCAQKSTEWFAARIGKPTASNFGKLITPQGARCTGAKPRRYFIELLSERLTGAMAEHYESDAMVRGSEMEPKARDWFTFTKEIPVRQIGFLDGGRWGGSPDGLCEDRIIEIKCPLVSTFVDIAESKKIPEEHFVQMQGLLWLTGLPICDYVLFTDAPGLTPLILEVRPDEKVFAALEEVLPVFCDNLDAAEKRMRADGHGWKQTVAEPPSWDDITNGEIVHE